MRRIALLGSLALALAVLPACDDNDDLSEFTASPLSGSNEVPSLTTAAGGSASFTEDGDLVRYSVQVQSMTGVTMAHIHSGVAGTNGPIRVTLYSGPVTGAVNGRLVEGSFTATDVNGLTLNELLNEMRNGNAYVNVHSLAFPNGEIRAQVRLED
jgi:CHRD domain-containing protein